MRKALQSSPWFLAISLAVGGCGAHPPATTAQLTGRVAFASTRDGNTEIYSVRADGSDLLRLTNSPSEDNYPLWSPDGSKMSFLSDRSGNWELWIMNADGSGPSQLTHSNGFAHSPSWAPDGKHIAFSSNRNGGDWDVYLMGPDGSNVVDLTNSAGSDYSPSWSPDGTKLAFISERGGHREIYLMNADGSNQRQLTSDGTLKGISGSAWAPTGDALAYFASIDGQIEVFRLELATGARTQLTQNNAPVWDPVADPQGKHLINVTVTWALEGNALLYVSNRNGVSGIDFMSPKGERTWALTEPTTYSDYSPHWVNIP